LSAPAHPLGHSGIDGLHLEWEAALARLQQASGEAALAVALDALITSTEHHFGTEQAWMEASDFAPAACHAREHEGVLEVLREVQRRLAAGDTEVAQRLGAELPRWFELHATTMDAQLAQHLAGASVSAPPG
jgi:hemerythrin-like metal-binding protein